MALQILSPPVAMDPQSPFPCTPSTFGGCSPPGQYFRSSPHMLQSSPNRVPRNNTSDGSASEHLRSTSSEGLHYDPSADFLNTTLSNISVSSPGRSNSSATSSPRTPLSIISSPSLPGSVEASPDNAVLPHQTNGRHVHPASNMKTHPSTASIPIILAGLGMRESLEKAVATSSESRQPLHDVPESKVEQKRASIGLGILEEPLELAGAERMKAPLSPLPEVADGDTSSSGDSSFHTIRHGSIHSHVLDRQDRVGSWTSSLLSAGESAASSVLPTPEPSPRSKLFDRSAGKPLPTIATYEEEEEEENDDVVRDERSVYRAVPRASLPNLGRNRELLPQQEKKLRSPSTGSEFSVSAYNYSPDLSGGTRTRVPTQWSVASGESRVGLLQKPAGSDQAWQSSPTSPRLPSRLSIATGSANQRPPNRKRAVTVSTAANGQLAEGDLKFRRQSSPPSSSPHRFQADFGTLTARQRALFAQDYKLFPVTGTSGQQQQRPRTAYEIQLPSPTSVRFGKPLPAIPAGSFNARKTSSSSNSRPGTGISASARAWGLLSSPPAGDYQSIYSKDSRGSSEADPFDESRLHGRTSTLSSLASSTAVWSGPPETLALSIDQESFREIYPVFKLHSVNPTAQTVEYHPVHSTKAYPFHHSAMESAPVLRRLVMKDAEDKDFISKQAMLPIKQEGKYVVEGSEGKGKFGWKLVYRVSDRLSLIGRALPGERNITPVSFTVSVQLLNPANSRKRKVLQSVYKSLTSKLEALRVGDLPADFVHERG